MKKLFFIPILMALFMLNVASTCSNDDDNNSSADPSAVISTVTSGTWRITNFMEDNTNHTSDFTGYNFTFATSGAVTASNGTNTQTGVWSVTNDDDDDDSNSSNDLDFNIGFSTPADFAELTEDYDIVSRTSTKIVLTHVSGGGGGTDFLTFEKN